MVELSFLRLRGPKVLFFSIQESASSAAFFTFREVPLTLLVFLLMKFSSFQVSRIFVNVAFLAERPEVRPSVLDVLYFSSRLSLDLLALDFLLDFIVSSIDRKSSSSISRSTVIAGLYLTYKPSMHSLGGFGSALSSSQSYQSFSM